MTPANESIANAPVHESRAHFAALRSVSVMRYRARRALPATLRTANTPADFFPIGVWYQPTYMLDQWKDAGINTLVGYESDGGSRSLDDWNRAAVAKGLYMIRQARKRAQDDRRETNLLAWMFGDEPDLKQVNPQTLANAYASYKNIDANRPIFVNYSGGYVLGWQKGVSYKLYQSYLASTDWGSSDIYPVTGWGLPQALDAPGRSAAKLSEWSGGKPQFAFIETSDQELPWLPRATPGVTPGQLRTEIWSSINRGAKGIIYFPQKIGWGFQYDATPPDVLAEMQIQNARLKNLGAALQSPLNPAGLGLSLYGSLQGSWRISDGKRYFIVTNTSDQPISSTRVRFLGSQPGAGTANVADENRTVAMNDGTIYDSFAAYETHVYVVG